MGPFCLLYSRFGIEMVPLDQEDQSQEEDDLRMLEGFHWDSLTEVTFTGGSRKRSLSESSLAPAPAHSHLRPKEMPQVASANSVKSETQGSSVSLSSPVFAAGTKDSQHHQEIEHILEQFEAKAHKQPDKLASATAEALLPSDMVLGDSSSGTEQHDTQGMGKRRRAAGVSKGKSDFTPRDL